MKYMILLVIMVVTATAFADTVGDKQLTSRAYVDNTLDAKQDTIPAAGKPGVAAGDTVLTYTPGGNGVIGERGIYSDASNYNASTDADKLITAAALNDTFNSLPTVETSTMVCANYPTCTLWTIIDQRAYGGIDPATLVNTDGFGTCFRQLLDGATIYYYGSNGYFSPQVTLGRTGTCTTAPANYGDWGTVFNVNGESIQINGISACSANSEPNGWTVASDQNAIQSDYESNMAIAPTSTPTGHDSCYCKMTEPAVPTARWVFGVTPMSDCAQFCAYFCANRLMRFPEARSAVFTGQ